MGLADFLAQAGQGSVVGNVAQAFGGRTAGQSALDNFINNDLPAIYDQAKSVTDDNGLHQFNQDFIAKAARAGLSTEATTTLYKELGVPLQQGLQADALNRIKQRMGPQTTQQQLHGAMGPDTTTGPAGPSLPTTAVTTPGRDPNTQDMMDIASTLARYGKAPEPIGFQQLLETPGKMAFQNEQTSNEQTKNSLERGKYNVLESLPNIGIGDTGVSPKALGYTGGLGGYMQSQQPARPTARDALIPSEIAKNQAETIKAQRPERPTPNTYRDAGDHTDIINPEGQIIGTLPKNAPPTPKMSDKDVLAARDLANRQMNSTRRYAATGAMLGETPEYNNFKAQFDALDQEAKDRGLIPSTSPAPTQAAGRPGPPRPRTASAAPAKPKTPGQKLDAQTAAAYLQKAGGDKNKARQMAAQDGYSF